MRFTITIDDGDKDIELKCFMRPPKDSELEAVRRLSISSTAMSGTEEPQKKDVASIGMQYLDHVTEIAKDMLYRVDGEVPVWAAADCETPLDVVLTYCISEVAGAAQRQFGEAMTKFYKREASEQALTKN